MIKLIIFLLKSVMLTDVDGAAYLLYVEFCNELLELREQWIGLVRSSCKSRKFGDEHSQNSKRMLLHIQSFQNSVQVLIVSG